MIAKFDYTKLYVTRVFANRVMYHATRVMYHATRECRCCLSLYSV